MENGIKISLDEVSATAQTIRTLNTKMNSLLEEAKGEIDKLASSWQSDGADAIREKISRRAATFEYSCAAEPPVRCGVSHLSRRNEPF